MGVKNIVTTLADSYNIEKEKQKVSQYKKDYTDKNCEFCGDVMVAKRPSKKYCCDACRQAAYKARNKKKRLTALTLSHNE